MTEEELRRYGASVAAGLSAGAVIALTGELGAGKTTFAQAVAAGLGVREAVTSPTFTLVQEYRSGRLPFYHFDVYRLASSEDAEELGIEEYFYGDGVCVVEWAERVEALLPPDAMRVHLAYGPDEGARDVVIS